MKKLKVGIIGLGYIGESHIEAVRRISGCEIKAVADTNAALARAKAETYGVAFYSSVEDILADKDIDAVHNCTPTFLHEKINRQVIESGKHLLTEKPLCRTYAEAVSLVELSKKHPETVVGVNYNYRLNPLVQEMKHRIMRGDLGEVRIASGSYQQDWLLYDTDYSWRLEPEISGKSCAIADIGTHWMDAVQYVTGHRITELIADLRTMLPKRKKPLKQTETFTSAVPASYELKDIENEEYGAVIFRMDNGASGVFHVSELAAGHGCYFNFEINGAACSMRWNQEENDRLWIGRRDGDNSYLIRNPNTMSPEVRAHTSLAMGHPEGWNDAFKGNIQAFYRFIAEGKSVHKDKPCFATLEDAAYLVKLTEKIIESSKSKRWVKID